MFQQKMCSSNPNGCDPPHAFTRCTSASACLLACVQEGSRYIEQPNGIRTGVTRLHLLWSRRGGYVFQHPGGHGRIWGGAIGAFLQSTYSASYGEVSRGLQHCLRLMYGCSLFTTACVSWHHFLLSLDWPVQEVGPIYKRIQPVPRAMVW
jgi:hypothetical protein